MYTKILGTGSYLPEQLLTNADLEKKVDTTDEWIFTRTGIKERHVAAETETSASMGAIAAERAMEAAGIEAKDLGLIVTATCTPDRLFPSTATLIQAKIGNVGAAAFDLQAACAGFCVALSVADQYVKSGMAKYVLVIGTETLSRLVNWEDRATCVLFGDGAGAVIVGASEEPGIYATTSHSDGRCQDILYAPNHFKSAAYPDEPPHLKMQGREVFKVAVRALDELVTEMLEASGLKDTDIDWLIPHQANIRIITATAKKLKLSMDKVVTTVHEHGNTSAASIPLALDQAVRDGRIQRGQHLLLETFGGGVVWSAAILKF